MSDIFLGYARSDEPVAARLEQCLRERGWSVFLDVQTSVGRRWDEVIENQLHAAKAVVVLWSSESRKSEYVLEEADVGRDKRILFPAFIEEVDSPYGFRRIQTANLIGWRGERNHSGLEQLVAALGVHLSGRGASGEAGAPGTVYRDALKDGGEGPLLTLLPVGRFLMGAAESAPGDSEGPYHEVQIGAPFAIGVYPVTFDDYDRFCRTIGQARPDDCGWGRGKRPVINVSWRDAQRYCEWLGAQTARVYGLPSEAQWEYACRAGTDTPFRCGAQLGAHQANFAGSGLQVGNAARESARKTSLVDAFPPNAFGVHDMHGNVWEWCQDEWHDSYAGAPADGSPWQSSSTGGARVLRGGSWHEFAVFARSCARHRNAADYRSADVGIRVMCSSLPAAKSKERRLRGAH